MRSDIGMAVVTLLLGGCVVERGNQPAERPASVDTASPHRAAPDTTSGPMHQVFDRRRETLAPGVVRLTLRMLVSGEAGRDAQQASMEAVAEAARRADASLAAVRVLAFLPPPPGHGRRPRGSDIEMVPLAYLDWVPAGGWDSLTARSAGLPHHLDVLFVQDLPAHPGMPEHR
jgi:hypothetical protein